MTSATHPTATPPVRRWARRWPTSTRDRITGDQEKRSIQLEDDRSRAEDLDMIKGISDFQNQQVGYEAALKSYASVQKLSLFNFIS